MYVFLYKFILEKYVKYTFISLKICCSTLFNVTKSWSKTADQFFLIKYK